MEVRKECVGEVEQLVDWTKEVSVEGINEKVEVDAKALNRMEEDITITESTKIVEEKVRMMMYKG